MASQRSRGVVLVKLPALRHTKLSAPQTAKPPGSSFAWQHFCMLSAIKCLML